MREMIEAALLGVVEALTEFLPVSSTGHLIIAADLLGFEGPPGKVFEVVIQVGSVGNIDSGSITNTLPLVYDIQAPQINALGEVNLTMTIGRPGETNLSITIFWGDGTVETFSQLILLIKAST